jgi:hypothetical protein
MVRTVLCTCHSLIYPCSCRRETGSDAHACDSSSVSTVALGCLARAYFLSSLSDLLLPTHARTPTAARRSTLSALNPTQTPPTTSETPRSHSCRSPSSLIMHKPAAILLLLRVLLRSDRPAAAVPAGCVSVDLVTWRVLSWPPG